MHDPMTVAFQIRYPWYAIRPWTRDARRKLSRGYDSRTAFESMTEAERATRDQAWPDGYRNTFVIIWHNDPERDGSDDSCGWSYPNLSGRQKEMLRNAAWGEGRDPYFLRVPDKKWNGTRTEAESLYRGLVLFVADVLRIPLTFDEAARMASRAVHNPDCVDAAGRFCFEHGYHTNFPDTTPGSKADQRHRQDHFVGVMGGIASELLRARRPWWRHPKWHVHHWRIQVQPWHTLRRMLFDRCATCGKGFKRGQVVISGCWDTPRPKLFRSTPYLHHEACRNAAVGVTSDAAAEREGGGR